jgi:hypothetical protein
MMVLRDANDLLNDVIEETHIMSSDQYYAH